jgi:hypothetical protein
MRVRISVTYILITSLSLVLFSCKPSFSFPHLISAVRFVQEHPAVINFTFFATLLKDMQEKYSR